MRRRDLLTSLGGVVGAAGLAGCLGDPGGSVDSPTETPYPTDSGDHPVTPTRTTFAVVDRSCGGGENVATVTFGVDSVQVQGTIGGRDTCDTAKLASAGRHLDVLEVVVEVIEDTPTNTVACGQCLTDIGYMFSASELRGGPALVRVVHVTADGRETVTVADRP